ncbi:DMT family transporter [Sphingosinicella sp. BN140058]|uniref:DMT family transporter n=1 Tax=Sphingosinicella sp. BN140058 TaxID=1892855 RepID=UPI0010125AA6|nr:DMT family transporter [Sphingosinicella sp. BN140058]QAY76738.1 DMT family transporter [Sphingosinicella sp. BN140058]
MAAPARTDTVLVPFLVGTLGIALFSAMDAVMKGLALGIGAFNAVFWRMLVGLALSTILYAASRPARPTRAAMRFHVIRGIVGAFMALTFFWGIARMPLAEAVALTFVAPLVSLYLAAAILDEPVGKQAVLASLVGFAGVLLIVATRTGDAGGRDWWGVASVLTSAMLYAYNIILMRQQALVAKPLEIAFYQYVVVVATLAVAAPFLATPPAAGHWPNLFVAAILALISLMLLAWAYARAEAHRLAPVEYTALVWAAIFGFLVFAEPVRLATLAGAALIVAGCILAARTSAHPEPAIEAMP